LEGQEGKKHLLGCTIPQRFSFKRVLCRGGNLKMREKVGTEKRDLEQNSMDFEERGKVKTPEGEGKLERSQNRNRRTLAGES